MNHHHGSSTSTRAVLVHVPRQQMSLLSSLLFSIRLVLIAVIVQLIMTVDKSDGFVIDFRNRHSSLISLQSELGILQQPTGSRGSISSRTMIHSTSRYTNGEGEKDDDDNNNNNSNGNGSSISNSQRYPRCPDYPSFAYYGKGKGRVTKRVSLEEKQRNRGTNGDDDDESPASSSSSSSSSPSKSIYGAIASPTSPLEYDFILSSIRDSARRTRLLDRRSYASREPYEKQNLYEPPCLDDLKPPPFPVVESLWISLPYRIVTFALSYYLFPYFIDFLDNYVTMEPDQLAGITSKFGPGVSILYGTFTSLTLSILYGRQKDIQNDVAVEASQLALITRNLLNTFRCDRESSIQVGQSCADQIRILAKGSRGSELLAIMYSDPYARMLEIIDDREYFLMERNDGELGGEGNAIGSCRAILENMYKIRADRLSDESLALPPTHYFIMTSLTGFILLGYAVNVLPTVASTGGSPSNESAIIFGLLTTLYVIFYNFAQDLNNPFTGLYQIRRSSAAAHLLQTKWLLVNNPYTRDQIDFDEPKSNVEDVLIRTPGIGEMLFTRDEIYPDDAAATTTTNGQTAAE